jgi:hypothetical protein
MAKSTLLTSPVSQLDFAARLAFFALAPVAIVPVTLLFPVTGTLISVALALVVFVAAESLREWAGRSRWVNALIGRELGMVDFYRRWPPRPFLYYVFYPLLFPYWLLGREARREFWFYKGYTAAGLGILVISAVVQYVRYWPPELGLRSFWPLLAISLVAEAFLVLSLLMPLATSVIWLHQTFRRKRLMVLLLVGLVSTSVATLRILYRRDPVVSYATRYRVRERTAQQSARAKAAQTAALWRAWQELHQRPEAVEGDGKVEGRPLELARTTLQGFYKQDEAFAFDLWAAPRRSPRILVLYFEARRKHPALWVALRDGKLVEGANDLPRPAFAAMRRASE